MNENLDFVILSKKPRTLKQKNHLEKRNCHRRSVIECWENNIISEDSSNFKVVDSSEDAMVIRTERKFVLHFFATILCTETKLFKKTCCGCL